MDFEHDRQARSGLACVFSVLLLIGVVICAGVAGVEREAMKLGPYILGPTEDEHQGIYTGDAKLLSEAIPDESVDLIFTDPIYQNINDYRWLAEAAARVLKPRGNLLAYCAHVNMDAVICAMRQHVQFRWLLIQLKRGVSGAIFGRKLYGNYIPVLWFGKDLSLPIQWAQDVISTQPQGTKINFKWAKNPQGLAKWLDYFSDCQSVIIDTACGGGAIPATCKTLGRRWLAFEIDPDVAETARQRVRQTQPPLFVLEPEQLELSISAPQ